VKALPQMVPCLSLGIRGIYPSGASPPAIQNHSTRSPTTERKSTMRDLVGYALYSLVGLLGLLLVFTLYDNVETEAQIEQLNAEIITFITGIRKVHRAHPNIYGNGTIPDINLINAGIAPDSTIAGSELKNGFGGDITVAGVSRTAFTVAYEDVPRDICIQALSRLRPDNRVERARAAASAATLQSQTGQTFPISFTQASTICSSSTNAISVQAR